MATPEDIPDDAPEVAGTPDVTASDESSPMVEGDRDAPTVRGGMMDIYFNMTK
ncbi:hypothetical protein [Actinokineospora alba]|nr:hypothetical protein [Actinokineospora alba]